jgi:photosystem II stability/assembly factor-like uncharacterized protein
MGARTSVHGPALEDAEEGDRGEDGDEEGKVPPGLWFYRQRMGSDGTIPLRARADAYEEVRLMQPRREGPRVAIEAGGGPEGAGDADASRVGGLAPRAAPADLEATGWVQAGPTLVGGRASALAADPNDPTHAWLGTADGGVFTTHDGGVTWTPVFDAQPSLSIGAIAAHPASSSVVYVGTGEEAGGGYSYDGDGIYKTTDGGSTWRNMGLSEVRRIGKIAIDPVRPDRIFVAAGGGVFNRDSHRGVYRSLDGGATWQRVLYVADDSGAADVAIDPSQPNRIYAAIWTRYSEPGHFTAGGTHSGIWQSTNGGSTWTRLTNGLPAASPTVGRIGLAIAPSSPQVVYASYTDYSGLFMGVWKTTNGGASWSRIDNGNASLSTMGYYFGQIRVDPENAMTVYLLDASLWKSTDGGVRWTARARNIHADQHDLLLLPEQRAYLANDGGAYWTTGGADQWTKSAVLAISQIYDIGVAKTNPLLRIAGLQDNGTVRTTTGSASSWTEVIGNDGMACEIDPVDASRVYGSYQAGNLFRSTNGGGSFTGAKSGIDAGEQRAWNSPIVHDPIHTQRLFTGTERVYRSVNGASSWTPISPVLSLNTYEPHDHDDNLPESPRGRVTPNNHGANRNNRRSHTITSVMGVVTTIAVSPVNTQILWAGTDDGYVWTSPNDGASWMQVSPVAPGQWVTRVACDPFDAQTAYVSVSGYQTGVRLPHVFKTTNLGLSWTDISANLPQAPINAIVADPAAPGRIFVGGDVGVFMTQNGGGTWFPLAPGLPHVVVMEILLHEPSRTLFAATYGRSMYSYDLSQLATTDSDGDGVPNASDCAPADGGAYAAPAEVFQRPTANDDEVAWNPLDVQAGPGTGYDVLRGLVPELRQASRPSDVCLATSLVAGSLTDTARPAPGGAFFYLVRARNACGTGTWGTASSGAPRVVTACP